MHREFVYVGDPVPELNEQEHAAFLMNIHKSILLSLEKRKLLTHSQRERCLVELEKQYSREQKSRRRAYAKAADDGLFFVKDYIAVNGHQGVYTLVTPKGKALFLSMLGEIA